MGENSHIEWTNHTWNPWYGCLKVSKGCQNCYMYRELPRYGKMPALVTRSKTTFSAPLKWAKRAQPGERVFACSWSDWFIPQADAWRDDAWDIIRRTPNLTYLILTKRPELAPVRLPADWGQGWPHVWIGASMEDQATAKLRMKHLLAIPAQHRFVSCEPLLGPVDLVAATPAEDWAYEAVDALEAFEAEPEELIDECEAECDWVNCGDDLVINPEWRDWANGRTRAAQWRVLLDGIHWVIAGGESGPNARPCHPDWVRGLRDQCHPEIPFFFKQWGEHLPREFELGLVPMVDYTKVGRRQAGHMLDGKEWRQMPGEFQPGGGVSMPLQNNQGGGVSARTQNRGGGLDA